MGTKCRLIEVNTRWKRTACSRRSQYLVRMCSHALDKVLALANVYITHSLSEKFSAGCTCGLTKHPCILRLKVVSNQYIFEPKIAHTASWTKWCEDWNVVKCDFILISHVDKAVRQHLSDYKYEFPPPTVISPQSREKSGLLHLNDRLDYRGEGLYWMEVVWSGLLIKYVYLPWCLVCLCSMRCILALILLVYRSTNKSIQV